MQKAEIVLGPSEMDTVPSPAVAGVFVSGFSKLELVAPVTVRPRLVTLLIEDVLKMHMPTDAYSIEFIRPGMAKVILKGLTVSVDELLPNLNKTAGQLPLPRSDITGHLHFSADDSKVADGSAEFYEREGSGIRDGDAGAETTTGNGQTDVQQYARELPVFQGCISDISMELLYYMWWQFEVAGRAQRAGCIAGLRDEVPARLEVSSTNEQAFVRFMDELRGQHDTVWSHHQTFLHVPMQMSAVAQERLVKLARNQSNFSHLTIYIARQNITILGRTSKVRQACRLFMEQSMSLFGTMNGIQEQSQSTHEEERNSQPQHGTNGSVTASGPSVTGLEENTESPTVMSSADHHSLSCTSEVDNRCPVCYDSGEDVVHLDCSHVICSDCLAEMRSRRQSKCPICSVAFDKILGDQPDNATMEHSVISTALPGHAGHGTIVITYVIPGGYQKSYHRNPGQRYHGDTRVAFLPDSKQGRNMFRLLCKAFEAKLTFTIGFSVTRNVDNVVTWNDIHHKTSMHPGPFGYPDPGYLGRLEEELAAKGIK
ncbi:E3 ubiquitin-protein ligase DTX3L-like [Sycon ciliatum]|uniref:E3 ubiquitin-protein ligase DTX3L-like n=1 Tax=Sycon ciliatum TaxID=27933 RepID=UPI0020A9CD36